MSKWSSIKFEEINYNDRNVCEIEGCRRPGTDAHHCLIPADKRFQDHLDHVINMQIVCHKCHMEGKADNPSNLDTAITQALYRYGETAVIEWLDGLPDKKQASTDEIRHKLKNIGGW
jgi:hypothetical protein